MNTIKFYKTRIYGNLTAKFADLEQEDAFMQLTGRKTLKPVDVKLLKKLGGDIEFKEITETEAMDIQAKQLLQKKEATN